MKNEKLLETVADISYIPGEMKFFSGDSRADVFTFITWAKVFQKQNAKTDWYETDYILSVTEFTEKKITEYLR